MDQGRKTISCRNFQWKFPWKWSIGGNFFGLSGVDFYPGSSQGYFCLFPFIFKQNGVASTFFLWGPRVDFYPDTDFWRKVPKKILATLISPSKMS